MIDYRQYQWLSPRFGSKDCSYSSTTVRLCSKHQRLVDTWHMIGTKTEIIYSHSSPPSGIDDDNKDDDDDDHDADRKLFLFSHPSTITPLRLHASKIIWYLDYANRSAHGCRTACLYRSIYVYMLSYALCQMNSFWPFGLCALSILDTWPQQKYG